MKEVAHIPSDNQLELEAKMNIVMAVTINLMVQMGANAEKLGAALDDLMPHTSVYDDGSIPGLNKRFAKISDDVRSAFVAQVERISELVPPPSSQP